MQSVPAAQGGRGVRPCPRDTSRVRDARDELDPAAPGTGSELPCSLHGLPSIRYRNPRIGTGANPGPHRYRRPEAALPAPKKAGRPEGLTRNDPLL